MTHVALQADTVDLLQLIPSPEAIGCIELECARRLQVVPIALLRSEGKSMLVVACGVATDFTQRERLRKHVDKQIELRWCLAANDQIRSAIERCYRHSFSEKQLLADCQCAESATHAARNDERFYICLLEHILLRATRRNASDIHFSPDDQAVVVRFRLDGVLHHYADIHPAAYLGLLVRLKVIAKLDIAETRLPQDGHFQQLIDGVRINFRASSFPVNGGEKIVLRLIGEHTQLQTLRDLKLQDTVRAALTKVAARPDGLILVCGPTGSGKSTTLFAMLTEKDKTGLNIMTLEDPVEHVVSGVSQTSIDESRAWGYSRALRAVLRQDPDVLLVGEVRDQESCSMTLRAVMTGHQVFTTVHANTAHSALVRLLELGALPGVLAAGLAMIVSQRLLRLSCPACGGVGESQCVDCKCCHRTGFVGRQIIAEILPMTPELAEGITQGQSMSMLEHISRRQGFVGLIEQANHLVKKGLVSQDEVHRVLGVPE